MGTNFVKDVLSLKASDIPLNIKNHVMKTYIKNPAWVIDDLIKASSAAGALASYIESQLSYADILSTVKPMEDEIVGLRKQGGEMEKKSLEVI